MKTKPAIAARGEERLAIETVPVPPSGAGEAASDVSSRPHDAGLKPELPSGQAHDRRLLEAVGAGTLDEEC